MLFLLFGNDYKKYKDISVKKVELEREWGRIDIPAEIELSNDKKYALFIELKYYSHTSEKQLEKYNRLCKLCDYKNRGFDEKFVLLGVWDDKYPEIDAKYCKKFEFTIRTFDEILKTVFLKEAQTFESSDNVLFDEFWTGIW